jgi:hypothetical protein
MVEHHFLSFCNVCDQLHDSRTIASWVQIFFSHLEKILKLFSVINS